MAAREPRRPARGVTPSRAEATRVFARIGLLSFGGPAAQIALMHRELVERHGWLGEAEFLRALSFCMVLPGPEAMQLATYAGWRLHGTRGGLVAGLLFVLPGAAAVLGLAAAYAALGALPVVQALFVGVKATVVVIVVDALLRIGRRALDGRDARAIALMAFLAIFALRLPFPLIIAAAALWGAFRATGAAVPEPAPSVPLARTLRTVGLWLGVWLLPLALLGGTLAEVGAFFARLAVVTFGGAYAVLAYMAQAAVTEHEWLTAPQMIDALGLAETTPGPLILVTEFVGYLAGHRRGGLALGVAAALVTLWATFAPCFLWIFAGAPYVERLGTRPRLAAALAAVTAAVVGVILNLSVWFALHVVFRRLRDVTFGPVALLVPDPASLDLGAAALAVLAAFLLLRLRWSVLAVLAVAAGIGAAPSAF